VRTERETTTKSWADEALLQRVQQENQRRVFGKLLHDLRNPVHSRRITIELFGRLARRTGDVEALMERAARYVAPAEAALNALIAVTARFGLYMSPPVPPVVAPVNVGECLDEIALLLGEAGRQSRIEVTLPVEEGASTLELEADRPRLSHALLRHCSLSEGLIRLRAAADADDVRIDVLTDGQSSARAAFTADEFRQLIENAGGALTLAPHLASLRFRRTPQSAG
jgi:hypothetical protein